jgi:TPR repeat protein
VFCTQCGQKAPEDAKFCGSCGANVLAEATTAASSITGLRSENLPPERQEFLGRAEAGDEDAMFELAGWCKSVGNLDTAIFWYQKLVELGDPFAAFELGRIFEEEDDDDQAEKLFLLSAKAAETTYAAEKLGQHYARRGKNIEARQWLLTAIEWLDKPDEDDYTEEDGANIHLELAKVLAKLDENAEAEKWFQKAVDAGNLEAMASFGIFLESQGEDERAHTWLKKSADAGHIPGLFFLGWFHEDAGRLDEAKKCFTKAAEADDDDAAYRLGLLYRAEGNHAEAERWLRKAADAGNDEAKAALESTPRTGVVIKTNEYEFELLLDGDKWWLVPREYFLNESGEWDEDEYQSRSDLSYTLSQEEAKVMDLPNSIDGQEFTMTDRSWLEMMNITLPQGVIDYFDNLPEYTVKPRD